MHAVVILLQVLVAVAWLAVGAGIVLLLVRLSEQLTDVMTLHWSAEINVLQQLVETHGAIAETQGAIVTIGEHLVAMRATLESVVRVDSARQSEPTRRAAMEAPQVPIPHGAAKTLLLMNADHTVAHEVTWHRDVPHTYAYGGRVFEQLGLNDAGQWEFFPC